MSATFDAYRKWLGILPEEQPPDHYRLLGIVRFEEDPDTISNAADRQMGHMRTFQTGPHSAQSQKLLNEIAAARLCLLNAAKKAEYDRQLRTEEASRGKPPVAAPAPQQPTPRPTAPMAPIAGSMPPAPAWRQAPPDTTPEVTIEIPQAPQAIRPATESAAPIEVAPAARRRRPGITLPKTEREPSDAHKTLLLAAGIAGVALAIFVVFQVRSRSGGEVSHKRADVANDLIDDDAEKARAIRESSEDRHDHVVLTGKVIPKPEISVTVDKDSRAEDSRTPQPPPTVPVISKPVAEPETDSSSIWAKLTRQLNDLSSWHVNSGQWSKKGGRLQGHGDSRLIFPVELPERFLLSFEMTVVDGMRPRVIFMGDKNFHFGNEGYVRTLFVHDGILLPIVGAPRPYATGVPLKIACRITEQEIEFQVDGELVARCGRERSGPLKLALSAGDYWSKGQVLFGPFALGPAPPKPLAALPPKTSGGSIDRLAPEPSTHGPAAKDGGWRDVFDGKSLDGWTGDVGLMRVQNGILVNNGKPAIVMAPGEHEDFELELEFRLAQAGNSGLGICHSGSGQPAENGLEVELIDDGANPRLRGAERCGAIFWLADAKAGHFKRWPQWNQLRVTSLKDVVRVELNGTLVTDTTRSGMKQFNPKHKGVSRTSGKICLLPLRGRSEYRHIRIRSAK
jgi:hypothetical protein